MGEGRIAGWREGPSRTLEEGGVGGVLELI